MTDETDNVPLPPTAPAQPEKDQAHFIAMDLIQSRIVDSRFYHAVCLQIRARQQRDNELAKVAAAEAAKEKGILGKLFSPAKPK